MVAGLCDSDVAGAPRWPPFGVKVGRLRWRRALALLVQRMGSRRAPACFEPQRRFLHLSERAPAASKEICLERRFCDGEGIVLQGSQR